ncbi:MAG: pyridoxal-phosphate dependent enzyme, partial [Candidatus Aminicenantes bacterium]|nr:pyridoxal-phosphate dependent enzyme [Candidatus Aminicenantes bacterium]
DKIPEAIRNKLPGVGMDDLHPLNLFRISWKNDPSTGLFGSVNALELPAAVTGVEARVIGLVGQRFPTGAHKVGAAFGCLVPRLVSGEFDPEVHKAVWPSTGNYCRGGAFDCALLGCRAVAILPEEMSRERFEWLRSIGAEVIATPGCESNVKEIYDKCRELAADPLYMVFNQFSEFGNPLFHYQVTGPAAEEAFAARRREKGSLAAFVAATGSAGTIAAGDYLKTLHPGMRVVAAEAWQCPTLFMNGFGGHRIEGIGDKHVPWVHNVRQTDAVAAVDDEDCLRLLRLFNEEAGHRHLRSLGVSEEECRSLSLLGLSGICNLLAAVKAARFFEFGREDVILTVFTDSLDLYRSRLGDMRRERGEYRDMDAARDQAAVIAHQGLDGFKELGYQDRKALHNLKYFTWVEQQGKTVEELNALWRPDYWREIFTEEIGPLEGLIADFNREAGR